MTTGLIQPIHTVQAAIKAGILIAPCESAGSPATAKETLSVRLPSEVGIAKKKLETGKWKEPLSRRTLYKKRPPRTMRYVITKKDRPELFK